MKILKRDGTLDREVGPLQVDQDLADKVRAQTRPAVEKVYEQARRIGRERRDALEQIHDEALKRSAQE